MEGIIECMRAVSQSRRAGGGFTLVELLVVISIILLLLTLVLPSVDRARILGMRTLCRNNVREIARQCMGYANEPRRHRGAEYQKALPTTEPSNAAGNAASLWLLVKCEMAGRDLFICPEAKTRRGHKTAAATHTQFDQGGTTLSYSYLSQVNMPTSLLDAKLRTSLVIVADRNPGDGGNSLNHQREGQNIGRLDGSAEWLSKPTVDAADGSGTDNIYSASSGSGPARGALNDAYLLPEGP